MSATTKKKLRKEQNAAALAEKQLSEKKAAKKLKLQSIAFITVMALVICIALGTVIHNTVSNSGIIQRNTRAVTIGEHDLNAVELNYFYIDYILDVYNEWREYYGDYTDMYIQMLYGLDATSSLHKQHYDTEGKVTWAEYFANLAIDDARGIYAIYDLAVEAGHTLSEEEKSGIDYDLSMLKLYAVSVYGYKDSDAYLKAFYGPGSDLESYTEYLNVKALSQSYFAAYGESLNFEESDLRAYENDGHYNDFTAYSFSSFYFGYDEFLAEDADTEDDAVVAAALAEAEKAANAVLAAAPTTSEEMTNALVALENYPKASTAKASDTDEVLLTAISDPYAGWLKEEGRKVGDLAVLPRTASTTDEEGNTSTATYGYYVVLLTGINDNTFALANVRHILSSFEGGTTDSSGVTTYSESEKLDAHSKLKAVLDAWLAGEATEESFAALVKDNTDDSGSAEKGGLYEDVYPGQMVTAFNDWCFDESREVGDYEIIETEYGYHLMYYVGDSETSYRDYLIEKTLSNEALETWYEEAVEKNPGNNPNISKLNLNYVISGS